VQLRKEATVALGRLSVGEKISGISAILLYVSMCVDWFSVKVVNASNLLFLLEGPVSGESALEALDYIPVVLLITVVVTLAMAVSRLVSAVHEPRGPVNTVIAILGVVSMLLILFRIVDPPNLHSPFFRSEGIFTEEVGLQFPIFLALLAAGGIALGGWLAMREERFSSALESISA